MHQAYKVMGLFTLRPILTNLFLSVRRRNCDHCAPLPERQSEWSDGNLFLNNNLRFYVIYRRKGSSEASFTALQTNSNPSSKSSPTILLRNVLVYSQTSCRTFDERTSKANCAARHINKWASVSVMLLSCLESTSLILVIASTAGD